MPPKRLPSLATLARSEDPLADRGVLVSRLKIERPESRHLEWRLTAPVGPSVALRTKYRTVRTILAFANTEGGFIVFGIAPHGQWQGLTNDELKHFDPADLEELLRSCATPPVPGISCADILVDNARFIVLHVPPSPLMPHVTTKEVFDDVQGSRRGAVVLSKAAVYCRHGAKSDLAVVDDYERIVSRRTERIKAELLRRVKEVEVPVVVPSSPSAAKTIRLSQEPGALPVRIVRDFETAGVTLVREELAEGIFDEINNVLTANTLLVGGRKQFSFSAEIYYRVYAERQNVTASPDQLELLARTGLIRLYAPVLYWLLLLPSDVSGRLLREMYSDPKAPQVNALLRIAIVLGPTVSEWLHDRWETKFGRHSQPPDAYWTFKKMVRRTGVSDRRLQALRTTTSARVDDGKDGVPIKDLLNAPDAASVLLSDVCRAVFQGRKTLRTACRDLDIIAYAEELAGRRDEIGAALMAD